MGSYGAATDGLVCRLGGVCPLLKTLVSLLLLLLFLVFLCGGWGGGRVLGVCVLV